MVGFLNDFDFLSIFFRVNGNGLSELSQIIVKILVCQYFCAVNEVLKKQDIRNFQPETSFFGASIYLLYI